MGNISSSLLPASFRGVPFLLVSHKQKGAARKTVVHEYPFKNTRFIEDLGKMPRMFNLSAIIDNNDGLYFSKRAALEEALSLPSPGLLVHPFSGVFLVRLMEPPVIEEEDATLNIVNYTLHFGETTSDDFPSESGGFPSRINSFAAPVRDALAAAFSEG